MRFLWMFTVTLLLLMACGLAILDRQIGEVRKQVEDMKRHAMTQDERVQFINLLMSVVESGAQPEKGSDHSKALGLAFSRLGTANEECLRRLLKAVVADGEYTPERVAEIEKIRGECLAKR